MTGAGAETPIFLVTLIPHAAQFQGWIVSIRPVDIRLRRILPRVEAAQCFSSS